MNKKAALNLGISTVVVMVIAMVVIGAGVSFIRTFFDAGTGTLIRSFDNVQDIGLNPDRNTPLVLERTTLELRTTGSLPLNAGFYNRNTNDANVKLQIGACNPILGDKISVDGVSVNVPSGESRGLRVNIQTNDAEEITSICSLQIIDDDDDDEVLASQQVTVITRP